MYFWGRRKDKTDWRPFFARGARTVLFSPGHRPGLRFVDLGFEGLRRGRNLGSATGVRFASLSSRFFSVSRHSIRPALVVRLDMRSHEASAVWDDSSGGSGTC